MAKTLLNDELLESQSEINL